VITNAAEIVRYDKRGALAERLGWDGVRRWLRFDQQLWEVVLPLFSGTLLVDGERRLWISAITSWYTSLQEDIGQRLGVAGNPTSSEMHGIKLLRSKSGALFVLGALLLLLFASAQNGWVAWVEGLLPPSFQAVLSLLAFSGALMLLPLAGWVANRPLRWVREFMPGMRWPYTVGAVGLGAVLLFVAGGGDLLPIPALNVGLLIWGAYVFGDALATLILPRSRSGRLLVIGAALLVAVALAAPQTMGLYYKNLGKINLKSGNYAAAAQAYARSLEFIPANQRRAAADSWNNLGLALYQQKQYRAATQAYQRAVDLLRQEPQSAERDQYGAALLFNRAWAKRQLGDQSWVQDLQSACGLADDFCRAPRQ
jgi:tetratricopeptide (TPR) repeat protein